MRTRRPSHLSLLRLAAIAAAATGVLLPAADAAAARDLCSQIGYAAHVIAEYEERGDGRAEQIDHIESRVGDRSPELRRYLLRLVDLVYRSDADPREFGATVVRHCTVDERGRAVVSLDWLEGRGE